MLMAKLLLDIPGVNYRNDCRCCLCESGMYQHRMFHFLYVCENPALVECR